jgi:hypothetical protein
VALDAEAQLRMGAKNIPELEGIKFCSPWSFEPEFISRIMTASSILFGFWAAIMGITMGENWTDLRVKRPWSISIRAR